MEIRAVDTELHLWIGWRVLFPTPGTVEVDGGSPDLRPVVPFPLVVPRDHSWR